MQQHVSILQVIVAEAQQAAVVRCQRCLQRGNLHSVGIIQDHGKLPFLLLESWQLMTSPKQVPACRATGDL